MESRGVFFMLFKFNLLLRAKATFAKLNGYLFEGLSWEAGRCSDYSFAQILGEIFIIEL